MDPIMKPVVISVCLFIGMLSRYPSFKFALGLNYNLYICVSSEVKEISTGSYKYKQTNKYTDKCTNTW